MNSSWVALLLCVAVLAASGQAPKAHLKPTEQLVKRYEELVAEGALLSPEGWARTSRLFERPSPYPANGEIQIQSFPGLIGELSQNGNRAQIETKWGDYYGSIDSHLKFKAPEPDGPIMMGEFPSLVFVIGGGSKRAGESGEWKMEGELHARAASPAAAIKYLEKMRDQSQDPVIRKNAERTIAVLKRMTPGCGNASAC